MTEQEISEAEIDATIAVAFGRTDPGSEALFREAGFSEDQARLGATLMESGNYLGFEDVATSLMSGGVFSGGLGHDNRPFAPGVTTVRIAEVAKRAAVGAEVSEGGDS